jgi:GDPmannose 4,6-dehydratase
LAARELDMDLVWEGVGLLERGIDRKTGRVIVRIDPRYFRPTEVDSLLGDSSKARRLLGWAPQRSFGEMIAEMVLRDLELARRDALMRREGFRIFRRHE